MRTDMLSAAHCVVHDDAASRPTPSSLGFSGALERRVRPVALASVTVIVAANAVVVGTEAGRAPVSSTAFGNSGHRPWKFPDSGVFCRFCEAQLGFSANVEVKP